MTERSPILLVDGARGTTTEAELIGGLAASQIMATEAVWRSFLRQAVQDALARGVPRSQLPEHKHWDWGRKARAMNEFSRAFGLEKDGATQGMMIVQTDRVSRLPEQRDLPLVYVDFLATAPWNLPGLMERPQFRGVGLLLVAAAARYSFMTGREGRIGLHSLEGAESFYRGSCGMTDRGIDGAYEDLRYFEMNSSQAAALLERTGI